LAAKPLLAAQFFRFFLGALSHGNFLLWGLTVDSVLTILSYDDR
jgi:hypothetical protein